MVTYKTLESAFALLQLPTVKYDYAELGALFGVNAGSLRKALQKRVKARAVKKAAAAAQQVAVQDALASHPHQQHHHQQQTSYVSLLHEQHWQPHEQPQGVHEDCTSSHQQPQGTEEGTLETPLPVAVVAYVRELQAAQARMHHELQLEKTRSALLESKLRELQATPALVIEDAVVPLDSAEEADSVSTSTLPGQAVEEQQSLDSPLDKLPSGRKRKEVRSHPRSPASRSIRSLKRAPTCVCVLRKSSVHYWTSRPSRSAIALTTKSCRPNKRTTNSGSTKAALRRCRT